MFYRAPINRLQIQHLGKQFTISAHGITCAHHSPFSKMAIETHKLFYMNKIPVQHRDYYVPTFPFAMEQIPLRRWIENEEMATQVFIPPHFSSGSDSP